MNYFLWYPQIIGYFCETKSKSIKKTAKIVSFSIVGIFLFFALLYMLLQNSTIQQRIAQKVVTELSASLHTKVSVGKIEYKLFNVLTINDLYVEDLQKDTLLFVQKADAHFAFWQFFRNKIIFTSLEIDQLYGNLSVDKSGHSNLDFVIDALKKPPTNDSSAVEYRIQRFKLTNSTFSYRNFKQFKQLPQGVFNGNNLKFKQINVDIALKLLKKDSMNVEVSELDAIEQSGFQISNLKTQILASKNSVSIPELLLLLPNSKLQFLDIQLKFDSFPDLKKIAEKVRWNAPIASSYIAPSDLKAFVPKFKNVKGVATIKGLLSGKISNMRFQKIEIKYGKMLSLKADLDINGLPKLNDAFIYGQINDLNIQPSKVQDFISEFSGQPFVLSKELQQLGDVKFIGNITGFLSNLVAFGNVNTKLGSVSTDILLKLDNDLRDLSYNGTVKSNNFQLGNLLNNKLLGKVSFRLNTKGTKKSTSSLQGIIAANIAEIEFHKYTYRDIQFDGKYDGKGFNGKVDVKDENIHARFNGVIDLTKKLPVFDFDLKLLNTNLNALNLTNQYAGARLSFTGKTNLVGDSPDNINGYVRFDSIEFENLGKKISIDNISVLSRIDKTSTLVNINSDIVNGTLSGDFKYSTVGLIVDKIIQNYLPSFSTPINNKKNIPSHVDVDLKISNTKDISDVLVLPYALEGTSTIKGYIDERTNKIDFAANIPFLKSSKQKFENISLHFNNAKNKLQLTSRALLHEKDGLLNLFILASAARDSVRAQIGWQNSHNITNAGEVKAVAGFRKENGKTAAQLAILPTQVIVSDSIWNIHPCNIDFNADSTIKIHNFVFDSRKQFIHVNGIASSNSKDAVKVTMNDISLAFILDLLKLKSISIGGNVTGNTSVFNVLKQPIYEANLSVKNVTLNSKLIGDASIFSSWDKENSQVQANAIFVNDKQETLVTASGVFVPKTDSLDFIFDAKKFNLAFLNRYFDGVAQNFKGDASGKIRMFGPSKILGFEGDVLVTDGQATVKTLRTTYYFKDSVHLTRKSISFRNMKLYDSDRNLGRVNGLITHNGSFQHMKYDVNIDGRNMLVLDTQPEDNEYFYGQAYANGNVHIYGDERVCQIDVPNAVSQPNTQCFINMGGATIATDNSFISFVNKKLVSPKQSTQQKHSQSAFNVKLNLQIDVTPDALMKLIVDPKSGDVITGKGNGSLRVQFDSFSDLNLFGTYTIDNGSYLFTLQNLIIKEFKINKGSTLVWTGSPYRAQVNIRAIYPLSASLKDLDQSLLTQNRSSVPVSCVLKLTDDLMKPTIKFDVELPQSDESVKQQVRSIISTEEMMNRQILYLLVFNKFYTPEYIQSATATNSIVPNEAISLGLSTLSGQVNNWLMRASDNFTIGFDYKASDKVSNESQFQTQLLYQPNSRLIVNGSFGYTNENANSSTNNNKFIGDVDVEYLLTESGKLRLKAYNHTVDRYRLTTAKTTQGVGILYKEDFSTVGNMFDYYWRLFTGRKNKSNEKVPK